MRSSSTSRGGVTKTSSPWLMRSMTPSGRSSFEPRPEVTMLEQHIRQKLRHKPLLLMTHIVIGYPSYRESWALARSMVEAGVDLMELQIPFSEPMADGPVILKANQEALASGATVAKCLEFARELAQQVPIPLLFMSYYNTCSSTACSASPAR